MLCYIFNPLEEYFLPRSDWPRSQWPLSFQTPQNTNYKQWRQCISTKNQMCYWSIRNSCIYYFIL